MHSSPTFALLGATRNTDNYGVRVLLSGASDALMEAAPDARLIAFDYGHKPEVWTENQPSRTTHIDLVNLRFSWRVHLPNNIFRLLLLSMAYYLLPRALRDKQYKRNKWLSQAHSCAYAFSVAGGDSFSDIYGLRRFLYVTLPQFLVILLRRPLVQLPQTYGPFNSALSRTLARIILRQSHTVFSRDEAGRKTVQQLLGGRAPTVHVVPDLGLAMSPETLGSEIHAVIREGENAPPLVGLNVSSLLHMGGYNGANMFGLKEPFPALIEALTNDLLKNQGVRLLLVPHVCGTEKSTEDETRLCKKLASQLAREHGDRVLYVDKFLNHRQIKALIGKCDIFIGARMHACIAAVSQAVPAVCLAYSGKFEGVMAPLGPGAHVVDLRTTGTAEVIGAAAKVLNARQSLRSELSSRLEKLPSFPDHLRKQLKLNQPLVLAESRA